MGYSGNMYATATEVITSQGDLRRGDSSGNPERLAIGSSGKFLKSNGTTESWEIITTADSTLTTQGDILVEGASGLERLGQSTSNYTLATKGASANPAWQASPTSILSGAQDILYASSANTLARLAAGTDGYVLTTHSTGSAPTWTEISGGATTTYTYDILTSDFTTSSVAHVDITGLSITLGSSGKFIVQGDGGIYNSGVAGTAPIWLILHDGTTILRMGQGSPAPYMSLMYTSGVGGTCDSTILKMQVNDPTGLAITTVRGASNDYATSFWVMEIA